MDNIKMVFEFIGNLDAGWKVAGVVFLLALVRKMLKSEKIKKKAGDWVFNICATFSGMLRDRFGKVVENAIEILLIDVREFIAFLLDRAIEGLRKDNDKREDDIKKSVEKKVLKVAIKKEKSAAKTAKIKNKIKGRFNLCIGKILL